MPSGKYIRVSPALHKAVAIAAAQQEMGMGDLVEAAWDAYANVKSTSERGRQATGTDSTQAGDTEMRKVVALLGVQGGEIERLAGDIRRLVKASEAQGVGAESAGTPRVPVRPRR